MVMDDYFLTNMYIVEGKKNFLLTNMYIVVGIVVILGLANYFYFHFVILTNDGSNKYCCKYSKFQINFQEANKPPEAWFELKVNPHIYVTGLPKDVTIEEVSCGHCFFYYYEYPNTLKRT